MYRLPPRFQTPLVKIHSEMHMNRISVPVGCQGDRGVRFPGTARIRRGTANRGSWVAALAALLLAGPCAWAQNGKFSTPQPVGVATATPLTLTVTASGTGIVASVEVLTAGVGNLDFTVGSGTPTCVAGLPMTSGVTTCTEPVTFTPTVPGVRLGAVVLLDSNGNALGTAYLSGIGQGGLGVLIPGNMVPVAGEAYNYLSAIGDGRPATSAELYWPTSAVLDGAGNLYIADSRHNRIRMVCASATSVVIKGTGAGCTGAGIIETIVGNGNPTYTGDDAAAAAATVNDPSGVALDGAGNLYIADTGNSVIRMVSAATGDITTIAGNSTGTVLVACTSPSDTVGDGCTATQAILNQPVGVTLDSNGNLYIADTNDHRIRMVTASTGIIATVAGDGATDPSTGAGGFTGDGGLATAAELNYPYTVAFDPSGNMYIPDSGNNVVREVAAIGGAITASSQITLFAGNTSGTQGYTGDGAAANQAELDSPLGVAVDAAGNVYIADTGSHAIRKVIASSGDITTLLNDGTGTYYYNSAFVPVSLDGPTGLYLDGEGNLYLSDSNEMIVREVVGNYAALDYTTPVRQYSQSAAMDQTVENDGNATLDVTAITPDANAAVNDTGIADPCATGILAVDTACAIGAVLAPQVASDPLVANINVAGNTQDGPPPMTAPNSPLDIQLIGDATAVNSTTTKVAGSPNPAAFGALVTLTATVQTGSGTGNLTGTVTFYDGTTQIASGIAMSATTTSGTTSTATATFTTTMLPVGTDEITATYVVTNDPAHLTSTSPQYPEDILEATTTTLTSSQNPSTVGQNVTFTATVAINGGGGVTPDGTVTFFDGANAIGSQTLIPNGLSASASITTSTLTQGLHNITAQYSGGIANPSVQASTSNTVVQDVQATSLVAVVSGTPNPSNYGQLVTFTATVTPTGSSPATGAVNFYYGTTLIGTNSLIGSTNQTTITYSSLPVGTDNITATYVGDANNAPSTSTVPWPQMVNKTQTSTTVTATPQPNGIAGGSVSITATVQIVSGSASVTGTISFASGGTTLGAAPVNSSTGKATLTLNNVVPATYSIVATYSGDNNDDGSTSSPAYPYTIVQATTQTAVTFTPGTALVGQPVTFTANVNGNGGVPTGTVTFSANGTQIGAPVTLNTGTATLTYSGLAANTYTITATYSGDLDDATSTGTAAAQLVVGLIPTTTELASASTTGTTAQVVLVAVVLNSEQVSGGATPTPTGTVTFEYGTNNTVIGAATLDSNAVATLPLNLPTGTYTIVAVYNGDQYHSGSTSQPVTISTTATNFNLTVTPGSVTMAPSQNDTVTVTLTSVSGFSDTIGLGCASLPNGVTCHFSAISVPLAANGTATAQLTIDTNNPLSGGSQAMNSRTQGRRAVLAGLFLPFSLFFGWIVWRFRKRNARILTLVLFLVLSAAAMLATGCGGFSTSSAAPGIYVIQVTGTGSNSTVIHYQNVNLTIT